MDIINNLKLADVMAATTGSELDLQTSLEQIREQAIKWVC